jgi:hypothetical protein
LSGAGPAVGDARAFVVDAIGETTTQNEEIGFRKPRKRSAGEAERFQEGELQ